ncbi:hypothetical protein RhiLY_09313 [Ceratobasidium sp. AG-Ba]|nr:hypothetical protein RhiLY_09313 [Ceratobasidium sp. AG-Ba]
MPATRYSRLFTRVNKVVLSGASHFTSDSPSACSSRSLGQFLSLQSRSKLEVLSRAIVQSTLAISQKTLEDKMDVESSDPEPFLTDNAEKYDDVSAPTSPTMDNQTTGRCIPVPNSTMLPGKLSLKLSLDAPMPSHVPPDTTFLPGRDQLRACSTLEAVPEEDDNSVLVEPRAPFSRTQQHQCESPTQETWRMSAVADIQQLGDIFPDANQIRRSSDIPISIPFTVNDSGTRPYTVDDTSRKILIMGSNYTRGVRRTFTVCSNITLLGPTSDKEYLKDSFARRGFSTHSFVNDEFDRDQALDKLAGFLQTARPGDIRAIVFTGHAAHDMLIPPNCPTPEIGISSADWERTIRDNAQSGVVVLSIFATCYSGSFMQQPIDLRNLNSDIKDHAPDSTAEASGPILITFSSASASQISYESSVAHDDLGRVGDHFLYALDQAARSPHVRTWAGFIDSMEYHLQQARKTCSNIAAYEGAESSEAWIANSPQTPVLTFSHPFFKSLFSDRFSKSLNSTEVRL